MKDIKIGKSVSFNDVTITETFDVTYMNEKLPDIPKKRSCWKNGSQRFTQARKLFYFS